jgi:AcrR family transcriptional regulator
LDTIPALNRHKQRKAATRDGLLHAAREIIIEKGYDNVDILDITDRANVSKATFYQHFPNKEECARQLMLQGFDALVKQIMNEQQSGLPGPEWIYNSYYNLFSWAAANREFLLIMLGGAASHKLNIFGRQYMVEITERLLNQVGYNREGIQYPPILVAQVITGILIQLLSWWLEHDTGYSAAQLAELTNTIVTNGLGQLA